MLELQFELQFDKYLKSHIAAKASINFFFF